jgi:hypothetical protein
MVPMYKIRKMTSRQSIWVDLGYSWRFHCRKCERVGHHPLWSRAMSHAAQHRCGGFW